MKIQWTALLFTLALYVAGIGAFLLSDKLAYRRGANDMGQSLSTVAVVTLVIGIFILRSLYQALRVDPSYWLVAGLHVVCILVVMYFFMF